MGMVVFNRDLRVFMGRRSAQRLRRFGYDNTAIESGFQFPQGGIDEGELPHQAAVRELWEETGMQSVRIVAEHPRWITYDFPSTLVGKFRTEKWRRWRGQKQRWYLIFFDGPESEIDLGTPGGLAEFDEYAWVDFSTAPDVVIPFKKDICDIVMAEFAPVLQELSYMAEKASTSTSTSTSFPRANRTTSTPDDDTCNHHQDHGLHHHPEETLDHNGNWDDKDQNQNQNNPDDSLPFAAAPAATASVGNLRPATTGVLIDPSRWTASPPQPLSSRPVTIFNAGTSDSTIVTRDPVPEDETSPPWAPEDATATVGPVVWVDGDDMEGEDVDEDGDEDNVEDEEGEEEEEEDEDEQEE